MGSGTSVGASMVADPMAVLSMVEEDLSGVMVAVQEATGIKCADLNTKSPTRSLLRGARLAVWETSARFEILDPERHGPSG